MKCPHCQKAETKVIESRDVAGSESIRRRRECLGCKYRCTTYERIERANIVIIKKDNTRQLYDRAKLVAGLQTACEKTAISGLEFEDLIVKIESEIYGRGEAEISSKQIGNIVMDILADVNQVAYVRFACVYRNFKDIESFENELHSMRLRSAILDQ